MLKSFKYRLYPSEKQINLLNKHIGAARFLYNLALETKKIAWASNKTNLTRYDLQKQLTELKSECTWLKEVNSQSLQVVLMNLDAAYFAFFKGKKGFPVFKKKSNIGSFNIPQNVILNNGKLIIPKFKSGINITLHRQIKGDIRQATISKTPTGKYFVSILCETMDSVKPMVNIKEDTAIGVDLGIKKYIVTSNGREFDNPKFLYKAQNKLKYIQRKFSKYKGEKTKYKLAVLHEKVANKRKDFLHKTSSELINSHDSICIEDLAVSNMVKNHKLAQSINDAGWATFVSMLEYKAKWAGKNILKIGRFEPSSKLHANCGHINKTLSLKDREWVCEKCGNIVLRDLNAAINIKSFALKSYLSMERRLKNQGELSIKLEALTLEANYSKIMNNKQFTRPSFHKN